MTIKKKEPGRKCTHDDCFYRRTLSPSLTYCAYILENYKPRDCDADKCTHYVKKNKKTKLKSDYEYNIYEEELWA